MNTTSIDNIDAKDTPTAIATHHTAAMFPFFSLPRELRDEIYDLAALDEQTLYCDVTLRGDAPSQKTAHAYRGAHRTSPSSQFEVEYSEAIARRVKSLVTRHDRNGFYFGGPGPILEVPKTGEEFKAEEIWLEVSKRQQDDGKTTYNIHALMLAVSLLNARIAAAVYNHSHVHNAVRTTLDPCVVFAFKFPDKAELGPRFRFDCYWDAGVERHRECLYLPSDDDCVLQQVLGIAKEVDWKGAVREYMMWQRYVVKYARRGIPRSL
jgi:hypothetical protein